MTTDLTQAMNEVLRRVGRNLIIFQQIEPSLKALLANHKNAGTPENYATNLQAQAVCINKKMLGHLARLYSRRYSGGNYGYTATKFAVTIRYPFSNPFSFAYTAQVVAGRSDRPRSI